MVGLRGRVLPTTSEDVRLRAEMESGQMLTGETTIVAKRQKIRRLSLEPSPRPLPDVLRALVNADGIVVGPGSLYTSILPNLLVEGVASTIYGVNAVRIYVANLMTEPGETDHYTLDDHLRAIRLHAGFDLFDYILVNRRPLDAEAMAAYAAQGSRPVKVVTPLRWAGQAPRSSNAISPLSTASARSAISHRRWRVRCAGAAAALAGPSRRHSTDQFNSS